MVETARTTSSASLKRRNREHYDRLNRELDSRPIGRFSRIMNWGYADDAGPGESTVVLPPATVNRNAARLLTETVGSERLTGKDVLEIGCGRGGNLALLRSLYRPGRLTGLDLCPSSIEFCRRTCASLRIELAVGDAEHLPFTDRCFDAVLSIESAHSYPEPDRFHLEVARVLRPGGAFLIADMFITEHHTALTDHLAGIGLPVVRDRDVTHNVLLSRQQSAGRQLSALGDLAASRGIAELWGAESSTVRALLAAGTLRYRLLTARRSPAAPPGRRRPVDRSVFTAPSAVFAPFWNADAVG